MCNMIVDGIAYTFGVFIGEFATYFGEGKGTVAWVGSLLSGVYLSAGKHLRYDLLIYIYINNVRPKSIHVCVCFFFHFLYCM